MPEHLRSLVVILCLAVAVFAIAKSPFCAEALTEQEFTRRRNLWLGITLAAFLSHNFWVFMLFSAILLYSAAIKETNKVALVLFVLIAVPLIRAEIPGFGGIRYFFDLDYFKLISLIVLLPAFFKELSENSWKHFQTEVPDKFLYAYLLMILGLFYFAGNLTSTFRAIFLLFIDVFVPYAVVSRLLKDVPSLRSALASYVIGASVIAAIGIAEFSRSWLLYNPLEPALGVNWNLGQYLKRDELLRAMGTGGQAIPFGYTMAVGFCLILGLSRYFHKKFIWLAAMALLGMGLIASYSRGPWLGALIGLLVFLLTGPHKKRNLSLLAVSSMTVGAILMATPLGDSLTSKIMVESGSFDYRERVFEVSLRVIMANPIFGAYDFLYSPAMQELKQGQGIIDIVNTYIAVGLRSGFVGLILFTGFLAAAWYGILRGINLSSGKYPELIDLGRSLLAAHTCILVTIFTVSSISYIPIIYYIFSGLAVAYLRLVRSRSIEATVIIPTGVSHVHPRGSAGLPIKGV